jgi:hypothetical protein
VDDYGDAGDDDDNEEEEDEMKEEEEAIVKQEEKEEEEEEDKEETATISQTTGTNTTSPSSSSSSTSSTTTTASTTSTTITSSTEKTRPTESTTTKPSPVTPGKKKKVLSPAPEGRRPKSPLLNDDTTQSSSPQPRDTTPSYRKSSKPVTPVPPATKKTPGLVVIKEGIVPPTYPGGDDSSSDNTHPAPRRTTRSPKYPLAPQPTPVWKKTLKMELTVEELSLTLSSMAAFFLIIIGGYLIYYCRKTGCMGYVAPTCKVPDCEGLQCCKCSCTFRTPSCHCKPVTQITKSLMCSSCCRSVQTSCALCCTKCGFCSICNPHCPCNTPGMNPSGCCHCRRGDTVIALMERNAKLRATLQRQQQRQQGQRGGATVVRGNEEEIQRCPSDWSLAASSHWDLGDDDNGDDDEDGSEAAGFAQSLRAAAASQLDRRISTSVHSLPFLPSTERGGRLHVKPASATSPHRQPRVARVVARRRQRKGLLPPTHSTVV